MKHGMILGAHPALVEGITGAVIVPLTTWPIDFRFWRALIEGGWNTWRRQSTRYIGPKLTGTEIRMLEIGIGFFANLREAGPF